MLLVGDLYLLRFVSRNYVKGFRMYLCSHCANERKWVYYNNNSTVSVAKGKWKRAKGISCHRTNIFLVLSQGEEEKNFFSV